MHGNRTVRSSDMKIDGGGMNKMNYAISFSIIIIIIIIMTCTSGGKKQTVAGIMVKGWVASK